MGPIGVLTNPHAAGGRALAHRDALAQAAGPGALVLQTQTLDELPGAVDALARAGCRYWVADGGDGTLHWLLSTWHQRRHDPSSPAHGAPAPVFLPTRGGSIDFVAHKLGVRGGGVAVVRRLRAHLERDERPPVAILDTLRVTGVHPAAPREAGASHDLAQVSSPDGAGERLAFAAALAGVAQRFFDLLYEHPTVHPVHIARLPRNFVGRVEHLFARTRARAILDGAALPFCDIGSAQIGAIDIDLGGVVRTFRKARRPGVLHAQVVGLGPAGIVANLPSVVLGTPLLGPRVFDDTCRTLTLEPLDGQRLAPVLDGERYTCPGAVTVDAGPSLSFACV